MNDFLIKGLIFGIFLLLLSGCSEKISDEELKLLPTQQEITSLGFDYKLEAPAGNNMVFAKMISVGGAKESDEKSLFSYSLLLSKDNDVNAFSAAFEGSLNSSVNYFKEKGFVVNELPFEYSQSGLLFELKNVETGQNGFLVGFFASEKSAFVLTLTFNGNEYSQEKFLSLFDLVFAKLQS